MWPKPYSFFTSDEFCVFYNQNALLHLYYANFQIRENRKMCKNEKFTVIFKNQVVYSSEYSL